MRIKLPKENLFFTSDPHFQHKLLADLRGFESIEEHNLFLIANWNKVVPPGSNVVCGGDFVWTGNIDRVRSFVDKLNGNIYLVLGNHDYRNRLDRKIFESIFAWVGDMLYLCIEKNVNFLISHYPLMYWRSGYYHLHGHVHTGIGSEIVPPHPKRYDIGVDNNELKPISCEELLNKLK